MHLVVCLDCVWLISSIWLELASLHSLYEASYLSHLIYASFHLDYALNAVFKLHRFISQPRSYLSRHLFFICINSMLDMHLLCFMQSMLDMHHLLCCISLAYFTCYILHASLIQASHTLQHPLAISMLIWLAGRKSMTDKASEGMKPDSQKSYLEQGKEAVTDMADSMFHSFPNKMDWMISDCMLCRRCRNRTVWQR